MSAPPLGDACQVSILEVLRTIINNEMYVQMMAIAPYLFVSSVSWSCGRRRPHASRTCYC